MATKAKVGKVECLETFIVTLGARPVEWRKAIVRDRHTGQLAEVNLTEYEPLVEEDPGVSYCFKRGGRCAPTIQPCSQSRPTSTRSTSDPCRASGTQAVANSRKAVKAAK